MLKDARPILTAITEEKIRATLAGWSWQREISLVAEMPNP